MSQSVHTLTARLNRMIEQIDRQGIAKIYAFILLDNQEIAPEARSRIGLQDTVYIKRIVLAHG